MVKDGDQRSGYRYLLEQLDVELEGENSHEWSIALEKFLRKQNPWEQTWMIDLDQTPQIPKGLEVVEHIPGGKFKFSSSSVILHFHSPYSVLPGIPGEELYLKLKDLPVMNACLLDWCLEKENRDKVPVGWRGKYVYFWGTLYSDSAGRRCVRYMYWSGAEWVGGYLYLFNKISCPAAVRVVKQ